MPSKEYSESMILSNVDSNADHQQEQWKSQEKSVPQENFFPKWSVIESTPGTILSISSYNL